VAGPLIDVRGMKKHYGGLRPLRLAALAVGAGDRVAITGVDAPAAENLVNLLTGATLPDEGEIRLFGLPTTAISDADDWLATLDRIGMVSPRAMLADELTVAQAIAMAFTLSLDPIPGAVAAWRARSPPPQPCSCWSTRTRSCRTARQGSVARSPRWRRRAAWRSSP
jgi:ABC-type uncharacterized transport system ATPase subunit